MADLGYLYQFRLILIGESTVGKSSLLRQFKEGEYFPDISLTVGVDFHAKIVEVNGFPVKLQLWDTAGQDRFRAIVKAYYRNAVGGLLVFDITHRDSFANLDSWLEDALRNAEPHKPVFLLVGNKCDQEKCREVSREEGEKYARDHGMQYIETSAKTGRNVEECFHMIARKIFQMVHDGFITVQDGWDGVKKGDPTMNPGRRSPFRENQYNGTVSFQGNVHNEKEQEPKRKCC
uniref:Rab39 n=1 Tax=Suberites domuncula TaxID=55567 RepID=A1XKT2_SUBDO|nr:Rab39 [Suberites domuncula]